MPQKDPLAEFSYGVGHIDPVNAADPGPCLRDVPRGLCQNALQFGL